MLVNKKNITIKSATLLSIKDASQLLSEDDRRYKGYWWLYPVICNDEFAPDVTPDGAISCCGDYVDVDDTYVRPVINIVLPQTDNVKIGDMFLFGGKFFKILSNHLAFCMEDIGKLNFNETIYDKNNYETSCIKEHIDDWFERANI